MRNKRPTRRILVGTFLTILLFAAGAQAQNLFFTSGSLSGSVGEITTNGASSTYASVGNQAYALGLAFDSKSNLFVAIDPNQDHFGTSQILEITPSGTQKAFSTTVNYPSALAFDNAGDLFEADYGSGNIYEFTNNNGTLVSNVTVFASGLNHPFGLAFDQMGDLFESDAGSNINEFAANGTETLFASGLNYADGLAFDGAGNLFEADLGSSNVYEFTTNEVRSTFAANVPYPYALAFNKAGILFVGSANSLIEITPNGAQVSLNRSGNGLAFQGVTLPVSAPAAATPSQNLFVVSENNILEFTPNEIQTVFASNLNLPYEMAFDSSGNAYVGASSAPIYGFPAGGIRGTFASIGPNAAPAGMAMSRAGILFVADGKGSDIMEVGPNGSTNVFASGLSPAGLAFDNANDLFEADELSGKIYEFTNNAGTLSSNLTTFTTGLNRPIALAFDGSGDLFEADEGSGDIYEFTNDDGTLSPNRGLFASGFSGLWTLAFNSAGNLFVAAQGNGGNVYELTPSGTQTTFASGFPLFGMAFEPVPVLQATPANGAIQITVTMPSPYYSTLVQASPDLVNWSAICTNTPPFTFTNSSPASPYFYRAMLNTSLY